MKSTTTSVNISMPAALKKAMHKRMAQEGFENVSEYVRYLIRVDANPASPTSLKQLEAEILRGVRSPKKPVDAAMWDRIRTKARARVARARKAG